LRKMKSKKRLFFSITALFISLMLIVGVTFAWFTHAANRNNQYFLYSGAADISAQAYMGLDDDFDGILNETAGDTSTRQGVLANLYVPLTQALINNVHPLTNQPAYFSDIYAGKSLTYKIVMANNGERNVSVDLSFGPMQENFFEALIAYLDMEQPSLTDEIMIEYYSANTARLLFSITSLSYTLYEKSQGQNDLEQGYNTQVLSNSYPGEKFFWQHIDSSSFVGENINSGDYETDNLVILPPHCLIEINFALSCSQNSNSIAQYILSATDYSSSGLYYSAFISRYPQAVTLYGEQNIKNAIAAIVDAERIFIYSNEEESSEFFSGKMEFEIPYLKLRGSVLPDSI
jgi:hypothetical protein